MESATFRRWLGESGCTFEAGRDMVGAHGHAQVTMRLDVGTRKALDARNWDELPGPASCA